MKIHQSSTPIMILLLVFLATLWQSVEAVENEMHLTTSSPRDTAFLDSVVGEYMNGYHLPGLAASIIKDGEIIWVGTYGWARIEDSIPVTDTTIWNLASVSKTVTAVAAMKAWEQDFFDLDENINDLLPFNVVHYFYPNDTITPRMLLVHNSGIEDNWGVWNQLQVIGGDSPVPLDTVMYNYLAPAGYWYSPANFVNFSPGSQWEYTNCGNSLAGYLTEVVTGDSFPLFCQQHIFDPLNMTRTSWFYANLDTNNIAMTYYYSGGQYYPDGYISTAIYPSSTLKSSVLDITRFLMMFMQYGRLDSVSILDSATVALMRTVQDTIDPLLNQYIGITWWYYQGAITGRWYYAHAGGWYGINTYIVFCPDENVGTVVLTNGYIDWQLAEMAHTFLDWAVQHGIAENTFEAGTPLQLQVTPNPFTQQTDIRCMIQDPGCTIGELRNPNFEKREPTLKIYDATGRLVRDFFLPTTYYLLPTTVSWDGRDNQNRMLGGGVYFVKLSAGDYSDSKKILLVR